MRAYLGLFALAAGACTSGYVDESAREDQLSGRIAPFSLLVATNDSSATTTQSSTAEWSLSKTGSVNASAGTVTWTITATELQTTANQLAVSGCLTFVNFGDAPATLGNMVVNLDTESKNAFTAKASDIANATQGAAATTALVDPHLNLEQAAQFSTGSASGLITLTSPCGGAAYSLEPEHSIAAGAEQQIGFTATYNNNVLALATGSTALAEVIVSYGNAIAIAPPDDANVKINGGSALTPDEAWISSAVWLQSVKVPAPTVVGSNPTISDAAKNITTTGSVTFSNPVFSLGATTGTVTVDVSGGSAGGTIENCATLTGTGVSLEACNTQQIAAVCTPGTSGCPWQTGDVVTYTQGEWSTGGVAASILTADYNTVYQATAGDLIVGVTGVSGEYFMEFDSAGGVLGYVPSSGTAEALTSNLLDPTTSSTGVFGGDVVATNLNISFSAAGYTAGSLGIAFGDLTLCNLTATPDLNGLTINQFLAVANTALGGGATTDSIADLDALAVDLELAFDQGAPSSFANANVSNGACQ